MDSYCQMNKLKARVRDIKDYEGITLIELETQSGFEISVITLELNKDLKNGMDVSLLFKESEVGVAKECGIDLKNTISYSNIIPSKLINIEHGKLLSRLFLEIDGEIINSIVTKKATERLRLEIGERLFIIIKATQIAIELG